MKIAIDARITPGDVGGVATYIHLLHSAARVLPKIEFVFLVLAGSELLSGKEEKCENISYIVFRNKVKSLQKKLLKFRTLEKLARLGYQLLSPSRLSDSRLEKMLMSLGVDILHCPIQDSPMLRIPTIYHPHDLQHLAMPNNFHWITRRYRERRWRRLASEARLVIVGSDFAKNEVIGFWKIDPMKVKVLAAPIRDSLERNSLTTQPSEIVLYPANLYPHKNHETIIRACSLLKNKKLKFVFTGSGPRETHLRKLAAELGVQDRILFSGPIEIQALVDLVNSCLLVVVSSQYEAGSFPILEALSRGKKVLASAIEPFLELRHPLLQIYGDPLDARSLALSIDRYSHEPSIRESVLADTNIPDLNLFAKNLSIFYEICLAGDPT